ncbi:alpha/beta hydrolase, partial [Alistipes sp. OttesenSCG-928-L06]|nr:alpha/beta hydrolase [Alistipes sp. OttesenSCG-928-L06]
MKKTAFLLLSLCCIFSTVNAQNISGKWYGTSHVGAHTLRIIFDISQEEERLSAKMQSPDQSPAWIDAHSVELKNDTLNIRIPHIGLAYQGVVLPDNQIEGSFSQGGATFSLNLSREEIIRNRPQTPRPKFPYTIEDVTFRNEKAGIDLSGTLTIPWQGKAPYPAVILVSGSGPQDRDETLFEHKPFWVIADYLTQNGIAVLRYDDRGFGESEGVHNLATTLDLAEDALAGIEYLRSRPEIATGKVGLAGHSEGGLIAFVLAAQGKTDFILSLAGPGLPGSEILARQNADAAKAAGAPENYVTELYSTLRDALEIIATIGNSNERKEKITARFAGTPLETNTEQWYAAMTSPWMYTFLRTDPAEFLPSVNCPVWAVIGEKDLQ